MRTCQRCRRTQTGTPWAWLRSSCCHYSSCCSWVAEHQLLRGWTSLHNSSSRISESTLFVVRFQGLATEFRFLELELKLMPHCREGPERGGGRRALTAYFLCNVDPPFKIQHWCRSARGGPPSSLLEMKVKVTEWVRILDRGSELFWLLLLLPSSRHGYGVGAMAPAPSEWGRRPLMRFPGFQVSRWEPFWVHPVDCCCPSCFLCHSHFHAMCVVRAIVRTLVKVLSTPAIAKLCELKSVVYTHEWVRRSTAIFG